MGHKPEPKRGKRTGAALKKIASAYLKSLEAGKAAYKQADELLQKLLDEGAVVGTPIELTGGRTATLVDQFAGKNKVWKPCGVDRFKLEVAQATTAEG